MRKLWWFANYFGWLITAPDTLPAYVVTYPAEPTPEWEFDHFIP